MEDAGFVGCGKGKLNWSVREGPGVVRLGVFAWRLNEVGVLLISGEFIRR